MHMLYLSCREATVPAPLRPRWQQRGRGAHLCTGEREAFLDKYKATLCNAYGRIQPEYVEVPDAVLARTTELKAFFDCSYEYVASLKPKPTTKKKK